MSQPNRFGGTIHFDWNSDTPIPEEHRGALVETAMDQIHKQINHGSVQGKLKDNIYMLDSDPRDGVDYSGHWHLTLD